MIDLYYFPTPNTWKITIMLEECELPYRIVPVNTRTGEQFNPAFLKISPNNRVPAIIDDDCDSGPIHIFESGAILQYLADKTGRFLPRDTVGRMDVLQWVYWQVGGLGPMSGQYNHYRVAAPDNAYALARYRAELGRLFAVMNRRLADREHLAMAYSIADISCWCWISLHELQQMSLAEFPHLSAWFYRLDARPAVRRGHSVGRDLATFSPLTEAAKTILYGQSADTVRLAGCEINPEEPK